MNDMNDRYDDELMAKARRLATEVQPERDLWPEIAARLEPRDGFGFVRLDLADDAAVDAVFRDRRPEFVVHLAAQAGVRHALDHPFSYVASNLRGTASVHCLWYCQW